jgi:hypothetical protein
VRDGINAATLGIPAVALVTKDFWPQGDFVARSLGMPDLPRIKLPHPVAGTGSNNMREIARQTVPLILEALAGNAGT